MFSCHFTFLVSTEQNQNQPYVPLHQGQNKMVRVLSRAYVHNIPRTDCPPSTCSLRFDARRENRTVCHLSSATFVPARRFYKFFIIVLEFIFYTRIQSRDQSKNVDRFQKFIDYIFRFFFFKFKQTFSNVTFQSLWTNKVHQISESQKKHL